jgi:hypothetical protein
VTFVPSHARPQPAAPPVAHAERGPCGAPVIGVHVPTVPVPSHAWHWPEQTESQQTPSTQKLLPHSLLAAHCVPFAFAHVPSLLGWLHEKPVVVHAVLQQSPETQWALWQASSPLHVLPRPSVGAQWPPLQ